MELTTISVIVTTLNEGHNLARCLDRLRGFGEVIVVDSFSTDATLDIARTYPVVIYSRPYESAAKQKNWAIGRTRHEWVLILDADEVLEEDLLREIVALDANGTVDGYWLRRRSDYLGRWIRYCGWQRDKVLRLFRKSRGRYEEREVHEEIVLEGAAAILSAPLYHYPYRSHAHYMAKLEEYSTRGAMEYVKRGGRFPLINMLLHPPFRFLRMYVVQRGFLDGYPGLMLCLRSAGGVWRKYSKARRMKP